MYIFKILILIIFDIVIFNMNNIETIIHKSINIRLVYNLNVEYIKNWYTNYKINITDDII
jgi:hypothetical protein